VAIAEGEEASESVVWRGETSPRGRVDELPERKKRRTGASRRVVYTSQISQLTALQTSQLTTSQNRTVS
jgi:hypothetical protein